MTQQPPSQQPWLKAIIGNEKSMIAPNEMTTLSNFFDEFVEQVGKKYGLILNNDQIDTMELKNISLERYGIICSGSDPLICPIDALEYDEEHHVLMVTPDVLKVITKQWFDEQLPRLFAAQYALCQDHEAIHQTESMMVKILQDYQTNGMIDATLPIPKDTAELHAQLDTFFTDTLKLYTSSILKREPFQKD